MATKSEVLTGAGSQIKNAAAFLWAFRAAARGDLKDASEDIETRANLGDYGPRVTEAGRLALTDLDEGYRRALRRQLDPVFRNVLRLAGRPGDGSIIADWHHIRRYFDDEDITFTARAPTYATLPDDLTTSGKGGSDAIVGDSLLLRLTKDRFGKDLDGGNGAVITARCVQDQSNGAALYAETFEFHYDKGLTVFHDPPVSETLRRRLDNTGGGILATAGFHIGNAANASPANLGGRWRDTTDTYSSNYQIVSATTYAPNESEIGDGKVPLALQFEGNSAIRQQIRTPLRRDIPYLPVVAGYSAATDRRLTLSLGRWTARQYQFVGGDDGNWGLYYPSTLDENLFLDNFCPIDGNPLYFGIAVDQGSGANAGKVIVDRAGLYPGFPFNGGWLFHIPRQAPHAIDDEMTWTDTAPSDPGQIATLILEAYGKSVPTDGSPTVADPS